MSVDARSVGVLFGTGVVGAVLALGGAATVLAVVDSGTTGVNVRGGGPVVHVAVHGVNLTVGATDIALPAVVITSVLKPVGVPSAGATISVAVVVRVVAMATGPGVAGFLIVLIRPLFMVAAGVVVFAVVVPLVVLVAVVVVVFVPVVVLVAVVVLVLVVAVVVLVVVVVAVRAVVFVPARITRPVMFPMPTLTNAPERRTQVSGRSAGSAMRHGYIPQQFCGDVLTSNVEIHKSIDGHPISHFCVPSS